MRSSSLRMESVAACVDYVIDRVGRTLRVATPLGIGKPNALLNELYRRAREDSSLQLELLTALSLNPPTGSSELEERFLIPIRERVWGRYPVLTYEQDRSRNALPDNVRVIEFYMRSGAHLQNLDAQCDYISANYSLAARDILARGVDVVMQAVSVHPQRPGKHSLSSNPDLTLDVLSHRERSPILTVAQVNRQLPYMTRSAEVDESWADVIVDSPDLDHPPFAVPHEPVDDLAWAIGLHASAWVIDGGTLQVGIGALGDAVCHALRIRHSKPNVYAGMLRALGGIRATGTDFVDSESAHLSFSQGLYVASELISGPIFALFEEGIVKRKVYDTEDASYAVMQGAFFLGSRDFYEKLRTIEDDVRELIDMTSVTEVNRIFTRYAEESAERRRARFVNMTMKATLLGHAVSDQLEHGAVVSGVGGQADFVVMAHQLPDARSLLLLRATRGSGADLHSNIVFEYPHVTIPRHMRDVFVTEYGVADLRGKTDRECIEAMIAIADSRFQEPLAAEAKRAKKLPPSYSVPDARRANLPQRIKAEVRPYRKDMLPSLPFGSELSEREIELAGKLRELQRATKSTIGRTKLARALLRSATSDSPKIRAALEHMQLRAPGSIQELLYAQLIRAAYHL